MGFPLLCQCEPGVKSQKRRMCISLLRHDSRDRRRGSGASALGRSGGALALCASARGPRAQGAQRLLLLQQQLLLPPTPGRLVRAGWREAATGGGWRQGPRRRTLERRSAVPARRGPRWLVASLALLRWRFPPAVCRRRWVGRAAALVYSLFLDEPTSTSPPAVGRPSPSRVRPALRLLLLWCHRCGERAGRLLRQRRRAAACPRLLVLDELAFTSPTSVSRPSTIWARSLLRFFFCDATG